MDLGSNAIDKRTTLGKALGKWRADLVADLGGADAISTQESALVDLAVKSKLLLDSVDTWLLTQKSLVNAKKKTILPVVRERQTLSRTAGPAAPSQVSQHQRPVSRKRKRSRTRL
jgi:hypothetical protein